MLRMRNLNFQPQMLHERQGLLAPSSKIRPRALRVLLVVCI